jgi:hypothetical protein
LSTSRRDIPSARFVLSRPITRCSGVKYVIGRSSWVESKDKDSVAQ